jgi:catechol 2,3-dioxygenase-like lactoylglutathione lyase family enzyme
MGTGRGLRSGRRRAATLLAATATLPLVVPLAVLVAPTPAYAQPAPALAQPSLLRATLIVADVQRSLEFYRRLGFTVENEMSGPRDPRKSPFPLNAASSESTLLILASAAPAGGRLGLLAFAAPAPGVTRPPRDRLGIGDVVLVVDVPDAVALHRELVSAGVRVVEEPQVYRSRKTSADGRPMEGRVFHAFDPDGNLVELLQAPSPVKSPR